MAQPTRGALTKTGPGTLVLNWLTPIRWHRFSNGTLQINNATSFGTAAIRITDHAQIQSASPQQVVEFNNNCVIDLKYAGADVALREPVCNGTVLLNNLSNSARTFTIGGMRWRGTMSASPAR